MLQNAWCFVQRMYHRLRHNNMQDVLSWDVSTFRKFRSGTYRHIMLRTVGPYVAASLWGDLAERTSLFRNGGMWKASLQELEDFSSIRNVKCLTQGSKDQKTILLQGGMQKFFLHGPEDLSNMGEGRTSNRSHVNVKWFDVYRLDVYSAGGEKKILVNNAGLELHLSLYGQQKQLLLLEVPTPQRPSYT